MDKFPPWGTFLLYVILSNSVPIVQKKMVKTDGYGKIFSIYGKEALVYGQNQLAFISGPIKSLFQSFCGLLVIVPARNCRQHKIVYLINLYVNRSSKLLRFFLPGLPAKNRLWLPRPGWRRLMNYLSTPYISCLLLQTIILSSPKQLNLY